MPRSKYTAPVASQLVKTGAGALASLFAMNVAAATRHIWVFDGINASGAPGSLLVGPFPVAAGEVIAVSFEASVARADRYRSSLPEFSTGLFVASSTTASTFTQSVGSDIMGLEVEVG